MKNKKKRKRSSKKLVTSFILMFISVALFAASTYAWFTDTASVKGNKVFAGNLYVDLVVDQQGLIDAHLITDENDITENNGIATIDTIEGDIPVYTREFVDDESEKYYKLTNLEAPFLSLYNVEPGQAYPVTFGVLNSGDLAIKYTAGFSIQEDPDSISGLQSYTGLEVLEKQYDENNLTFQMFHNVYSVDSDNVIDNVPTPRDYELRNDMTEQQYKERKAKLEIMQKDENNVDKGGHLEDILEVYVVDPLNVDSNGKPLRSAISEHNYIGTVKQIIDVTNPLIENEGELAAVESRMNSVAIGFCLPQETLKIPDGEENAGKYDSKDGVKVNVYDADGSTVVDYKEGVSELGKITYLIYMPEDATSLYQNAALFLDLGITATQVEFEFDGLNCMVYDKSKTFKTLSLYKVAYGGIDPLSAPSTKTLATEIETTNDLFTEPLTLRIPGGIGEKTLQTYSYTVNETTFEYLSYDPSTLMFKPGKYLTDTIDPYYIEGKDGNEIADPYTFLCDSDLADTIGYESMIDDFQNPTPLEYHFNNFDEIKEQIHDARYPGYKKFALKIMYDLTHITGSEVTHENPEEVLKYIQLLDKFGLILKPTDRITHPTTIQICDSPLSAYSAR